jgi:TPP-dependent pyruvate/acetoin dehydrogenase alpha subunit
MAANASWTIDTMRDIKTISKLYRALKRIRRVEERIVEIYPTDKIKSPIHLSIGQEAVSVGVCEALDPHDIVFGTYRSHALYLAKGGDLNAMMAELFGKVDGCAKGKAGSMHLVDVAHGVMGTSAVVGTTISNAVGFAFACHYRRSDTIVASFFGDGAAEEGCFYESLNFAALKKLPILFVCENNRYAIHSHQRNRQANDRMIERVRTFGIPAQRIEGNDVFQIMDQTKDAAQGLRSGSSGPVFLECMTYRWREHVGPQEDYNLGYRDRAEAEEWMRTDQVEVLGAMLRDDARQKIDAEIESEIYDAVAFAESSPFPDPAELLTDLFEERHERA